jgi:hypothetical protein
MCMTGRKEYICILLQNTCICVCMYSVKEYIHAHNKMTEMKKHMHTYRQRAAKKKIKSFVSYR